MSINKHVNDYFLSPNSNRSPTHQVNQIIRHDGRLYPLTVGYGFLDRSFNGRLELVTEHGEFEVVQLPLPQISATVFPGFHNDVGCNSFTPPASVLYTHTPEDRP